MDDLEKIRVVLDDYKNYYEPDQVAQIQRRGSHGETRCLLSEGSGRKDYEAKEKAQHEKSGAFGNDLQCKGSSGDSIPRD